ncbi:SdiA-regulated family protein [Mucilaginibacter terrenus]|uniref:SdiA-regulated family protein n=1 Tax=Mucilaginibacter terrenus TaxID=2482727 RepID=A0A3E2NVK2_9SPHI|nr:SdiA-regulated domain-containing protein [Mucilaginibacter terrenus]RFZ85038.1 SdiA-regulated family protein [Mucilaginibacter terrenus]
MKKSALFLPVLVVAIAIGSCSQGDGKGTDKKKKDKEETEGPVSPPEYDLASGVDYNMPNELLEISGIAFNNGDKNRIYAEQDEDGNIYYMKPGDKDAKSVKFGKHGDYEDVAIGNGQAVILRSDGEIRTFPLQQVEAGTITGQQVFKGLLPEGEYEGMHFDNITKKLYIICKQCQDERSSKEDGGFVFDLGTDGKVTKAGEFNINVKEISKEEGKKIKFRPSALARNPLTKEWYIVSSVNKLLVVTNAGWKINASYKLNKGFLQPEGIAFDSEGNLYISNEGDEISSGNILFFKYLK